MRQKEKKENFPTKPEIIDTKSTMHWLGFVSILYLVRYAKQNKI